MTIITFEEKGDFSNTERYLSTIEKRQNYTRFLNKYGSLGVTRSL